MPQYPNQRRFNRALAQLGREAGPDGSNPAYGLIQVLLAIIQGHGEAVLNATMDGATWPTKEDWPGGQRQAENVSTPDQVLKAMDMYKLWTYGQAPQMVQLEAHLQASVTSASTSIPAGLLTPADMARMLDIIDKPALPAASIEQEPASVEEDPSRDD